MMTLLASRRPPCPCPGGSTYNWRPCSYWNPAECTCTGANAGCPGGYTKASDGTKCYIAIDAGRNILWADAQTACTARGDTRQESS